jgi:hypothetical protein
MPRPLPLLALAACAVLSTAALAQQGWHSQTIRQPADKPKAQPQPAPQRVASRTPKAAPAPSPLAPQVQFLVRTSLMALNDANRTGNYTVLRDLASPSFREKNSAADLAQIFAEMRRARLDLSMAAFMAPELDDQPSIDGERRLRLKGSFATEPNRIVFDLVYEAIGGHWQLGGITISTRPSRTAAGGPGPR